MKDRIETIIKDYLVKQFGNEDALPKMVLSGIAEELAEHGWEFHRFVQEEYDLEDIEDVAQANGYKLTKREEDIILHRYKNLENGNLDLLYDIVDEVHNEREEE